MGWEDLNQDHRAEADQDLGHVPDHLVVDLVPIQDPDPGQGKVPENHL